jgi:hypothetical protein
MHCEAVRGTLGQHVSPRGQGELTELIGIAPTMMRINEGEHPR